MAAPQSHTIEAEDLSEEQIEQLLQQAEARLRAGSLVVSFNRTSDLLPHLDTSALVKPYVNIKGDVARADTGRLIDEKTRKLAVGIRKVEDPVFTKRKLLEVSCCRNHPPCICL